MEDLCIECSIIVDRKNSTEEEHKNLTFYEKMSSELSSLQGSLIKYKQILNAKDNENTSVNGPQIIVLPIHILLRRHFTI